ncbi:RNA polymerase factor sigma-70 [Candidatus Epulonipiscium fishelsonii]|uniref:RNA polymerase factor sigma-70 n=1 Tax=Candidatus Epulonipiscium fishelsonii TaxID=77094 RepID=A0ACC8XHE0_9FIRM|nr:RNA polymerase factor sigma-70 [Epulopiscium sp. SCG-D08WGA-EpuloA1]OON91724.1 MAG: RNA polymerase factor sigma-70 [Epulopiscium sp. AS2M-Bin002]
MLEKLTDEELIKCYREKNLDAIEILIQRYKSYVKKRIKNIYIVGIERDDLVQEGMIGVFKAVCEYNPSKEIDFRNFANICITNQMNTVFKAAYRKKHMPLNNSVSLDQQIINQEDENITLMDIIKEDTGLTPEELVISQENMERLIEYMKSVLSKFELDVAVLHIKGKSYQEIALLMNKSPKSIDNALQRIKRKLVEMKIGKVI